MYYNLIEVPCGIKEDTFLFKMTFRYWSMYRERMSRMDDSVVRDDLWLVELQLRMRMGRM
jgi:hypothetical protein